MKSIFVIAAIIFYYSNVTAQIDTIITKRGDVYPCTIVEVNNESMNTIDSQGTKLIVNLSLIKSAVFNSYGQIYSGEIGYSVSIDTLEQALERRQEQIEKAEELANAIKDQNEIAEERIDDSKEKPKFSFGIFYVPNSLERKVISFDNNSNTVTIIDDYSSQIESQLSYNLHKRLYLTFNLAYNSAFIKNKFVMQELYTDPVHTNDFGFETEQALKLFTVELGVKYYFMDLFSKRVSAFILAGIGKTYAWAKDETKDLFQDINPDKISTDNKGEFLEGLSSPFLFQMGFGTEYFFNKHLSVHSSIKLYYSTISAEYHGNFINNNYQRIEKSKVEESDIVTKVGIGLNFYF